MKGFVDSSIDFFSNHFFQIILVALIFLLIRWYLISRDIKFVDIKPHLEKVVVVESMCNNISNLENQEFYNKHPLYNKKFHDNLYERIKGAVDGGKEICSKFKEKSCNLIKHCGWTFNENEGKEKGICTPVYLNNDTPEPKHTLPNKDALYYNNKLYNI